MANSTYSTSSARGSTRLSVTIVLGLLALLALGFLLLRSVERSGAPRAAPETPASVAFRELEPAVEVELAPSATPTPASGRAESAPATRAIPAASAIEAARPLRLTLRSLSDSAPVPSFHVWIEREGSSPERLVSDAQGNVESRLPLGPTTCGVRLLEGEGVPPELAALVELEPDPASDPRTLFVRVGPTYSLVLRGTAPGSARLLASLRVVDAPWAEEGTPTAPVLDGTSGPWVRIPLPLLERTGSVGPWELSLADDASLAFGRAPVASAREGHRENVVIELTSSITLTGTIRDPSGAGLADATIALYPEAASSGEASRQTTSGNDGAYTLRDLGAGRYKVLFGSAEYGVRKEKLVLEPAPEVRRDFTLAVQALAEVKGILRGFSDGETNPCSVVLIAKATRGVTFSATPRLVSGSDGEPVGSFEFPGIPIQDYEARVHAAIPGSYLPEKIEVRPPCADLVFSRREEGATQDLGFVFLDRGTHEPLHGIHLALSQNGDLRRSFAGVESGTIVLPRHPPDSSFDWCALLRGYRPAYGDSGDFTVVDPEVEGTDETKRRVRGHFATVLLEPGWGARFHVRGPFGDLAGATIWIDGLEVGHTDAGGLVRVGTDHRPSTVEVRHPDFPSVRVDAADPAVGTGDELGVVIRMRARSGREER